MKYQVLFSLKSIKKYLSLSSAAVVIGALGVKLKHCSKSIKFIFYKLTPIENEGIKSKFQSYYV